MNLYNARQVNGLTAGLNAQSALGFLTGYLDMLREAEVALRTLGDTKACVVFSAAACEILLDDTLRHLFWEEGLRPEDAAPHFDQFLGWESHKGQLYSSRLGGNWQLDRKGPLASGSQSVAAIRNRVVHAGYEPSRDEAKRSPGEHVFSGHFLGRSAFRCERGDIRARPLCYRAMMVSRDEGGGQERSTNSANPNEPNWSETFARYRDAVQRLRRDSDTATEPRLERSWVIQVISPNGVIRWVAHDRVAKMAALVPQASLRGLTDAQMESGLAIASALLSLETADYYSAHPQGVTVSTKANVNWLLELPVVPEWLV